METVKRIIEWLSDDQADQNPECPSDQIVFEIDTLEDAARVGMGWN